MGKFVLGKKAVSVLLTVLLGFHCIHLYNAWKQSRDQIVEAVYKIPPALYAAQPGVEKKLGEVLTARLKLDNQLSDRYRPSIWDNKGEIHASFALLLPDPTQALGHLGADLEQLYRDGLPSGATTSQTQATSPVSAHMTVRLLSWSTRPSPGPKPLDALSLMALIGALLLWIKGKDETPSARAVD